MFEDLLKGRKASLGLFTKRGKQGKPDPAQNEAEKQEASIWAQKCKERGDRIMSNYEFVSSLLRVRGASESNKALLRKSMREKGVPEQDLESRADLMDFFMDLVSLEEMGLIKILDGEHESK